MSFTPDPIAFILALIGCIYFALGVQALVTGDFHGRILSRFATRRSEEAVRYWGWTVTSLVLGDILLSVAAFYMFGAAPVPAKGDAPLSSHPAVILTTVQALVMLAAAAGCQLGRFGRRTGAIRHLQRLGASGGLIDALNEQDSTKIDLELRVLRGLDTYSGLVRAVLAYRKGEL